MVYRASFDSCWAKLERAKAHREELSGYISETFVQTDASCPTLVGKLDSETGCYVFRIKTIPDLDPIMQRIGLIVGDVAQNLRAILDHLTWQLACWNTNGKPLNETAVQFPIVTSKPEVADDERWKSARGRYLKEVHPDHVAIIETFQPYNGRAGRPDNWSGEYVHPLALLQELANTDKHRFLNPVLAVPSNMAMVFPPGVEQARREALAEGLPGVFIPDVVWDHAGEVIELGAEVGRFRLEGEGLYPNMEVYGKVQPSIAFRERGPIVPALDRIGAFAMLIVSEFEPLL